MTSLLQWLSPRTNPIVLYFYHNLKKCGRWHRPGHCKLLWGYLQVCIVKIVLEVAGAGGAIWGSSEFFGWRTSNNTNRIWRPVAMGVVVVFGVRLGWQSKHHQYEERQQQDEVPPIPLHHHRRLYKVSIFATFSAKFILEVLGGGGAIWGSSEACTLRTTDQKNLLAWRITCVVVTLLFAIRWICQFRVYCLCCCSSWKSSLIENNDDGAPLSLRRLPNKKRLAFWWDRLVVRFILQVLGATGAIWGISDVIKLRTIDTLYIWRPVTLSVGLLFACRWLWQLCAGVRQDEEPEQPNEETNASTDNNNGDAIMVVELLPGDLVLAETVDVE